MHMKAAAAPKIAVASARIGRFVAAVAVAALYSAIVAVFASPFFLIPAIVWPGGYSGVILGIILTLTLAVALTVYLVPKLIAAFRKRSADSEEV